MPKTRSHPWREHRSDTNKSKEIWEDSFTTQFNCMGLAKIHCPLMTASGCHTHRCVAPIQGAVIISVTAALFHPSQLADTSLNICFTNGRINTKCCATAKLCWPVEIFSNIQWCPMCVIKYRVKHTALTAWGRGGSFFPDSISLSKCLRTNAVWHHWVI